MTNSPCFALYRCITREGFDIVFNNEGRVFHTLLALEDFAIILCGYPGGAYYYRAPGSDNIIRVDVNWAMNALH